MSGRGGDDILRGGPGHDLLKGGGGEDGLHGGPGNDRLLADNANLHWTNDRRGYVVCDVTPAAWRGDYRVLDAVTQKGLPIRTAASWAVENGKPGLVRA